MNFIRSFYFLSLFFLLAPLCLFGQIDTLAIPEIEVVSTTIREQSIGGQREQFDTDASSSAVNDLGTLLNQNGIFIKSYGSNSLATSSIRGGSAGHTLVLWNGLPIQSPMLGLLDLSLLPLNSSEKVTVQKGGSSAMWGSGAIGGVVAMENNADFDNRLAISSNTMVGSFGNFSEQLKLKIGNRKFQSVTKVLHQQAENDFSYPIAPGFPDRKQTNAAFWQQSFLQDFYLRLNNGHRLELHFWQQQSDKQIPATNVQTRSVAHQEDQSTRLVLDWAQVRKNVVIKSKAAWFHEHLDYFDELTELESLSSWHTFLGEVNGQRSWKNRHYLYLGSTYSHTKINAGGYKGSPSEDRAALFTSYQFKNKTIQLQASLRQEVVDNLWVPLMPVVGIDYQPFNFLSLKGKVSKNYRLPTFNDRFWTPGGNPDLLAESGWSEEITVQLHHRKGAFEVQWTNTVFNRNIDNWIMWSRVEGQQFWSANNIAKVWSRGLEERLSLTYFGKKTKVQFQLGYDYIRATNEVALEIPSIDKGTQLWYTPQHQGFVNIAFNWDKLELNYRHLYRSASSGVNGLLEDYQTGQFQAQYGFQKGQWGATLFCSVFNLWDVNYFVVEQRPMAGREFRVGLKINYEKTNNSSN